MESRLESVFDRRQLCFIYIAYVAPKNTFLPRVFCGPTKNNCYLSLYNHCSSEIS